MTDNTKTTKSLGAALQDFYTRNPYDGPLGTDQKQSQTAEDRLAILRGKYPFQCPAHVAAWAADEIERLQKIEAAARVQYESYGAYPGLIEALS